jgi:hypothetical protein
VSAKVALLPFCVLHIDSPRPDERSEKGLKECAVSSPELDRILRLMEGFHYPWFIAGGWALDLACGRQTRAHDDVDLCLFREHIVPLLRFFEDWEKAVAVPEEGRLVSCRSERDVEPPRHELHFRKEGRSVEFLLIDREGDKVLFRRDPSIRMPLGQLARKDPLGRPYVSPAWQLLFKAKNPRPKDEADFLTHLPFLSGEEKRWLLSALRIHHPSSGWIKRLENEV